MSADLEGGRVVPGILMCGTTQPCFHISSSKTKRALSAAAQTSAIEYGDKRDERSSGADGGAAVWDVRWVDMVPGLP